MLDSNSICKVPPNGIIPVKEFNYEELDCFLEFLYTGSLPEEKVEKHVRSLSLAADKYGIPYLRKVLWASHAWVLEFIECYWCFGDFSHLFLRIPQENSCRLHCQQRIWYSLLRSICSICTERPDLNVEITRAIVMQGKKKNDFIAMESMEV